jgi:acyl-CoA thioesterase
MDLTFNKTTFAGDDQRWLGSAHGTNSADTVKITISSGNVTTYGQTLPSGALLAVDGTVDPDGTTHTADGFLLTPIDISRGAGTYSGAILRHGQVNDAMRVSKGLTALTSGQKTSLAASADILLVG